MTPDEYLHFIDNTLEDPETFARYFPTQEQRALHEYLNRRAKPLPNKIIIMSTPTQERNLWERETRS